MKRSLVFGMFNEDVFNITVFFIQVSIFLAVKSYAF